MIVVVIFMILKKSLFASSVHYHENGTHRQSMTKGGAQQWRVCYPKAITRTRMCSRTSPSRPSNIWYAYKNDIITNWKCNDWNSLSI
jgi:hypothetical protein